MRWYVLKITITSQGSEDRSLTPYDDFDTAQRKWHECFNVIGGGPQRISAVILDWYGHPVEPFDMTWEQTSAEG